MGMREWANNHPKAAAWTVGGFTAMAIVGIILEVVLNKPRYPSSLPDGYFTTDDGKSYFTASLSNFPPFDSGGAPAVRAYVFESKSGQKFVGYLERYTADSKTQLDAGKPLTPQITRFGREIKRPGDSKWVKTGDIATENRIENIPAPDGDNAALVNLEPGT